MPKTPKDLRHLPASQGISNSAPTENPIPRGLQIPAGDTKRLVTGFAYPPFLNYFNVTEQDWKQYWNSVTQYLDTAFRAASIPHRIEAMLDEIARWDREYFRPRKLLMRWDMPGEEKYGLDFMDVWYDTRIFNFADNPNEPLQQLKPKKQKKAESSLQSLRKQLFESTRLVLDHIDVLGDPDKAKKHGWTLWNQACENAARPEDPEIQKRASGIRFHNVPWDFSELARKQRWPPSKQLYYDRYRCTTLTGDAFAIHIPDHDSMDQRIYFRGGDHGLRIWSHGSGSYYDNSFTGGIPSGIDPGLEVLPADHIPFMRLTHMSLFDHSKGKVALRNK